MKHCYIAPIEYLKFIPEESDMHLTLAHLFDNPDYTDFYRRKSLRGDFIINDNGAFELKRPMESGKYMDLIRRLPFTPNVVVAPDYPFEPWEKTVSSTTEFIETFGDELKSMGVGIMAVPQSIEGDWSGWISAYQHLSSHPAISWIGMSILGIPNAFKSMTKTDDISFNRVFATSLLSRLGKIAKDKKHHYLGCSDIRELAIMKAQGVAYSNDSSSAIFHGINKIMFDDSASGLLCGKLKKPVDFHQSFDPDLMIRDAINHNIMWINRLLSSVPE